MAFTPRDVIVYLNEWPWKMLVKNFNGLRAQSDPLTTFSKVTNYRNIFPSGWSSPITPVGLDTTGADIVTDGTIPAILKTNGLTVPDDATQEAAGVTAAAPRPEKFTRYQLFFGVPDMSDPADAKTSPYWCWEDEYRFMGDVDPNNELND